MRRLLVFLCAVMIAETVAAQPPPASYPIEGRFACLGYDKTLSLTGDLGSVLGMGGANNGVLFALPSRNVSLDLTTGRWDVELGTWTGAAYVWTHLNFPVQMCAYYQEVTWGTDDVHGWLTGDHTTDYFNSATFLTIYAYDGSASIGGDFLAGSDNGVLFALPFKNAHLIHGAGGAVWHGGLWIVDLDGVKRYKWAVYPATVASIQITTDAILTAITGQ